MVEGRDVGETEGWLVGCPVGAVGCDEGIEVGEVGCIVGWPDGTEDGFPVGTIVGCPDGTPVGCDDGFIDG